MGNRGSNRRIRVTFRRMARVNGPAGSARSVPHAKQSGGHL